MGLGPFCLSPSSFLSLSLSLSLWGPSLVMQNGDREGAIFLSHPYTNEPQHEIANNVVCATSKSSDQPAHTRRLIRAFASPLNIL